MKLVSCKLDVGGNLERFAYLSSPGLQKKYLIACCSVICLNLKLVANRMDSPHYRPTLSENT